MRVGFFDAPESAASASVLGLKCTSLQRLYGEWCLRRKGRSFPSREDFEPIEMKYILGRLSLIDVEYHPLRFRYRVHGTEVAERFGVELTGRYVHESPRVDSRQATLESYVRTVESREPLVVHKDEQFVDGRIWHCETLILPLSRDGSSVSQLMSGIAWW